MNRRWRTVGLTLCGAWLLGAAGAVLALRHGRPLHYTDGTRQVLGADLADAPMVVRDVAVPVAELPGAVRGRVQPLADGRLLYGSVVDDEHTELVVFDPQQPDVAPTPLVALASSGHDFAPAITADGGVLFASDRPGGAGGFDLWYAPRLDQDAADGPWFGEPRPLGAAVNTAADEVDPAPHREELVFVRRERRSASAGSRPGAARLWRLRAGLGDLLSGGSAATRTETPTSTASAELLLDATPGPKSGAAGPPRVLLRDPAFSADGALLWFVLQRAGAAPELRSMPRLGDRFGPDRPATGVGGGRSLRSPAPGADGLELGLLGLGERPLWWRSQARFVQPWWPGQWPLERALLVSMLGALLLGLLLALGARWRHVDVITWFLLVSLLVHLLLYLWLNGVLMPEPEEPESPGDEGRVSVRLVAAMGASGAAGGSDASRSLLRSVTRPTSTAAVSIDAPSVSGMQSDAGASEAAPAPSGSRRATERPAAASASETPSGPAPRDAAALEFAAAEAAARPLRNLAGESSSATQPASVSLSTAATALPAPQRQAGDSAAVGPVTAPAVSSASAVPAREGGRAVPRGRRAAPGGGRSVRDSSSVPVAVTGPGLRDATAASDLVAMEASEGSAAPAELSGLATGLAPSPTVEAAGAVADLAVDRPTGERESVAVDVPGPLAVAPPGERSDRGALRAGGLPPARAGRRRPGMRRSPRGSTDPVGSLPSPMVSLRDGSSAGDAAVESPSADAGADSGAGALAGLAAGLAPRASGAELAVESEPLRPERAGRRGNPDGSAGSGLDRPAVASLRGPESFGPPAGRRRKAPEGAERSGPQLYANRFGPRKQAALEQFGGTRETERAVADGLAYLAGRQQPDGLWGRRRARTRKYGDARVGKSGLCLLAFLGAGHLPDDGGPYGEHTARAVTGLLAMQDEQSGHFGRTSSYSHGIVTYALAECYALTKEPSLRVPLQRAVDWILRNQDDGPDPRSRGGWGYFSPVLEPEDGYSRSSVSAWMVMALESARRADLRVPETALAAASRFLVGMIDVRRGYVLYSKDPSRLRSQWRTLPASTPATVFCLQLLSGGGLPDDLADPLMDYVLQRRPRAFERVSTDAFVRRAEGHPYFWYYGTLSCFLTGGKTWERWNESLREVLPDAQRDDGSWMPIGAYASDYAGDSSNDACYTTALSVLSLEVYYRYFTPLLAPGQGGSEGR